MSVINNAVSTFSNNINSYGGLAAIGSTIIGNKIDPQGDSGAGMIAGNVIPSLVNSNPYGYAAGYLGMGLSNKLTGGTDGMTTADRLLGQKGISGAAFGAAAAAGGPVGWGLAGTYLLGSTLNAALGKNTIKNSFNNFRDNEFLSNMDSAYYRDSTLDKYYDKKYGWFSNAKRKQKNAELKRDQLLQATKLDISRMADFGRIRGGMVDANYNNYLANINGGYGNIIQGKHGLDISKLLESREILERYKNRNVVEIEKFQNGGTVNVIPEGALHARKHHMADDEHITKKGIPVVDNEGNQQAEIERNEIIFRKEVTDTIEKLRRDGSDEAAIEAGKLLTTEIMENTEDRTGLIRELTTDIPKHQLGGNIKPLEFKPQEFKFPDTSIQTPKLDSQLNANINSQKSILDNVNGQQTNKFQKMGDLFSTVSGAISNFYNLSQKQKAQNKIDKTAADLNYFQKKDEALSQEQLPFSQDPVTVPEYNPINAQKGTKVKELPNFTYQELLEYLKDRNDGDYDLEKAFSDKEVYDAWREEEEKNPGKGRWLDKYKKPTHITYSIQSVLGDNPRENGGIWAKEDGKDIFITSPYLENLHSLFEYLKYFKSNEPNVGIKYKGITYFAK